MSYRTFERIKLDFNELLNIRKFYFPSRLFSRFLDYRYNQLKNHWIFITFYNDIKRPNISSTD